ncbi:MAG: acylphosphatase [Pirellulales bacterium]|nr:acylphosphatase [Pirellulales bacterium]
MQRRIWRFTGRVQGVGFRATTRELARDFAVGGTVENLPSGGVRVVVEGAEVELAGFLAAIRRCWGGGIHSVDEQPGAATGEFADFDICY